MRFGSPKRPPAATSSTLVEPEPGPASSSLSIAEVASIFVRIRRLNAKHKAAKATKAKQQSIVSESGPPQTHESLAGEGVTSIQTLPIHHSETFICSGGVNVEQLLKATRQFVYAEAEFSGANVLINEQWSCAITPKTLKNQKSYRVHIRYTAEAARAGRPDPKIPIALDKAKSVEGLMTIEHREPTAAR